MKIQPTHLPNHASNQPSQPVSPKAAFITVLGLMAIQSSLAQEGNQTAACADLEAKRALAIKTAEILVPSCVADHLAKSEDELKRAHELRAEGQKNWCGIPLFGSSGTCDEIRKKAEQLNAEIESQVPSSQYFLFFHRYMSNFTKQYKENCITDPSSFECIVLQARIDLGHDELFENLSSKELICMKDPIEQAKVVDKSRQIRKQLGSLSQESKALQCAQWQKANHRQRHNGSQTSNQHLS